MLCALLVVLAGPAGALADGDPASDVLISSDAYYPYSPHPSSVLVQRLNALLKQERSGGHPFKVALIQTRADLGAYPELFGHPQNYAKLLYAEITYGKRRPHVLVVMPQGFGGHNLRKGWLRAIAGVKIDRRQKTNGLIHGALDAIPKLASDSRQ